MPAKRVEITLHKGTPFSLKSVELSNWEKRYLVPFSDKRGHYDGKSGAKFRHNVSEYAKFFWNEVEEKFG